MDKKQICSKFAREICTILQIEMPAIRFVSIDRLRTDTQIAALTPDGVLIRNDIGWEHEDGTVEIEDFGNPELLARAFVVDGGVEVANVDPRFVYATLMASKSLFVGIAQPLDESGSVSDPLVFINLIDSGVSWKGTYSELADRLGVGIAE